MRTIWTGRRQAERRECSIKAQAHLYDGAPSIDCIVTDFSPTGARIIFPQDRPPPNAFDLHVPSRGDTRHALVRWTTPEAVGVEFIQSRGSTGDQRLSELLIRVSKIEDELRATRADVALVRASAGVSPPAEGTAAQAPPVHAVGGGQAHDALTERVHALEERSGQDRTEWDVLADKLAAFEKRLDVLPAPERFDDTATLARVAALEERNGEVLRALRQALTLLGDLRDATAPLAKAG